MSRTPSDETPIPVTARSVGDLRDRVDALRASGRRVAFVPTMGALHEGHLSLVRRAGEDGAAVVVSIFVNPTQFGPGEDLERYPRDEAGDLAKVAAAGADLVFLPAVDDVYPPGDATRITVSGPPAEGLEAAVRPGHFDGVATVVARLLWMVRPDHMVMGQKDAQQVAVVRRMMRDLHLDDVDLVVGPTVREADGLAMSSRNAYLSPAERAAAASLSRGLRAGAALAGEGERDPARITAATSEVIAGETGCDLEYAALVDPDDFRPVGALDAPATLCVAVRIGSTRLIDNLVIEPTPRRSHVPLGRRMLKSKIHRATVTDANLDYVGSITVDTDLLEAADIRPYEQVQVLDINNGARFETYTIEGARGSGAICLNGAAARLVQPGDLVIVLTYADFAEEELDGFEPLVVHVDADNRQVHHVAEDTVPAGWNADA